MSNPTPSHGKGAAAPYGLAMAVPVAFGRRFMRAFGRQALCGAIAGIMGLTAGGAAAQSLGPGSLGGTVALTSQLVDRGVPVSRPTPVLQAAAPWATPSGWSAGISASSEARAPGRVLETLLQAGHAWALSGDWQIQAGALYYRYNPSGSWRNYDRTELGGSLAWRDVLTLGVSAAYMSHIGRDGPRLAADLDARWPLAPHLSLMAGAGWSQYLLVPQSRYYTYERSTRYGYGHIGLGWEDGPWRIELKRIGTRNAPRPPGASDLSRWNATVAWSF